MRRALLCVAAALMASGLPLDASAQMQTSVRLTSPLGRTGVTGTIRVVAQVVTTAPGGVIPVRFFVDDALLGEDRDGPPYVTEWVDENPYVAREIRVEVEDPLAGMVSDRVALEPLELVEETAVASVLVEATVTDEEGRAIASLNASEFTLFENDVRQQLDLVQLQNLPTHFLLLVDASQSMARRVDFVKRTAQRLVSGLRPNDTVTIAPFRREVGSFTGPTTDATTIADAIMNIHASGGTAIRDTLASLPALFTRADGRHVIILVTDGYDEHSVTSLDEALEALRQLGASVYVVGIGGVAGISLKGELMLRRIAAEMGGRTHFPSREEQLPDIHEQIVSEVYSRYLITYTPSNQEPDGSYRAIRLATTDPALRVRARKGYFAPKPPPIRPTLEFSAALADAGAGTVLSAADLTVLEDGVPQTLESFHEANGPMSIVLTLDGSGSMKRALDGVKAAARAFVQQLRPEDPLALIQFADEVTLAHEFAHWRDPTLRDIDRHQANGGTALWDALYESMALLGRQDGRRAVVLLTDGRDENNPGTAPGSVRTFDEVMALAARTQTTVYAIGLGPNVDRTSLEALATRSGGAAYFPEDVSALGEQYARVLDDLRRRYVVSYTSTNSRRDGAWRTVEISTSRPGIVIRSRGGYTAPASAHAAPDDGTGRPQ